MKHDYDIPRLVSVLVFAAILIAEGLFASGSGVTSGAFASYPVSVRGAAMGGANVSLTNGSTAPYHNPAWMGYADTRYGGVSYADLGSLGLVRNVYVDYIQPDNGYGASGLYFNWLGTEVEGSGGIGTLSYSENTFGYAYGKRVSEYFAVGAAVKGFYISTDIQDTGGKGAGLDLAIYSTPDPFSTVSLVVRNAISSVKWDGGLSDKLPVEIEFGGTYLILDELIAAGQLRFEAGNYTGLALGAEYAVMPQVFFVRGGFERRLDRTIPTLGIGVHHESFIFDYAAEIDAGGGGLGTTHRAGFSFEF